MNCHQNLKPKFQTRLSLPCFSFSNFHFRLMTYSLRSFLLFVFLVLSIESHATTLQDAVQESVANNRNIKLEKIKLKSSKNDKNEAIAGFLPDIKASIQYGNQTSTYKNQTTEPSTKKRAANISLEQPVFDGFHSVSKYQEAKYRIKSSSAKTSDKIQEISFEAVQSYCNLFRYQETIELQKENKDLGQEFLKLVKRREDIRIIDKSEIIEFEYETSINEEKYFDYLNKLNQAKFDYQNVIGEIEGKLIEPIIVEENFNKNEILRSALISNQTIKSSHYDYLASKAAHSAEKSNFLPKVSISASIGREQSVVYLDNQDVDSSSIFLNVSIPIFHKGLEYSNTRKAKYAQEAAKETYKIASENIEKTVNQALEEYDFFSEMNKTNKKLFDLSKAREKIFNKRSKSKIEDPIEVIRTQITTNDRKIKYIESQMNLVIAYYKIKYFLGEI